MTSKLSILSNYLNKQGYVEERLACNTLLKYAVALPLCKSDKINYRDRFAEYTQDCKIDTYQYTLSEDETLGAIVEKEFARYLDDINREVIASTISELIRFLNRDKGLDREVFLAQETISLPKYEDVFWGRDLGSVLYVLKIIGEKSYLYYVGETTNIFRRYKQHKYLFKKDGGLYIDYKKSLEDAVKEDAYGSTGAMIIRSFHNDVKRSGGIQDIQLEYVEIIEDKGKNHVENMMNRLDRERKLFLKMAAIHGLDNVRGAKWCNYTYAKGADKNLWDFPDYANIALGMMEEDTGERLSVEEAKARQDVWREAVADTAGLPSDLIVDNKLIKMVESSILSPQDVGVEAERVSRKARTRGSSGGRLTNLKGDLIFDAWTDVGTVLLYHIHYFNDKAKREFTPADDATDASSKSILSNMAMFLRQFLEFSYILKYLSASRTDPYWQGDGSTQAKKLRTACKSFVSNSGLSSIVSANKKNYQTLLAHPRWSGDLRTYPTGIAGPHDKVSQKDIDRIEQIAVFEGRGTGWDNPTGNISFLEESDVKMGLFKFRTSYGHTGEYSQEINGEESPVKILLNDLDISMSNRLNLRISGSRGALFPWDISIMPSFKDGGKRRGRGRRGARGTNDERLSAGYHSLRTQLQQEAGTVLVESKMKQVALSSFIAIMAPNCDQALKAGLPDPHWLVDKDNKAYVPISDLEQAIEEILMCSDLGYDLYDFGVEHARVIVEILNEIVKKAVEDFAKKDINNEEVFSPTSASYALANKYITAIYSAFLDQLKDLSEKLKPYSPPPPISVTNYPRINYAELTHPDHAGEKEEVDRYLEAKRDIRSPVLSEQFLNFYSWTPVGFSLDISSADLDSYRAIMGLEYDPSIKHLDVKLKKEKRIRKRPISLGIFPEFGERPDFNDNDSNVEAFWNTIWESIPDKVASTIFTLITEASYNNVFTRFSDDELKKRLFGDNSVDNFNDIFIVKSLIKSLKEDSINIDKEGWLLNRAVKRYGLTDPNVSLPISEIIEIITNGYNKFFQSFPTRYVSAFRHKAPNNEYRRMTEEDVVELWDIISNKEFDSASDLSNEILRVMGVIIDDSPAYAIYSWAKTSFENKEAISPEAFRAIFIIKDRSLIGRDASVAIKAEYEDVTRLKRKIEDLGDQISLDEIKEFMTPFREKEDDQLTVSEMNLYNEFYVTLGNRRLDNRTFRYINGIRGKSVFKYHTDISSFGKHLEGYKSNAHLVAIFGLEKFIKELEDCLEDIEGNTAAIKARIKRDEPNPDISNKMIKAIIVLSNSPGLGLDEFITKLLVGAAPVGEGYLGPVGHAKEPLSKLMAMIEGEDLEYDDIWGYSCNKDPDETQMYEQKFEGFKGAVKRLLGEIASRKKGPGDEDEEIITEGFVKDLGLKKLADLTRYLEQLGFAKEACGVNDLIKKIYI